MYWIDRVLFLIGFALVSRRELFIRQRDSSQYASVDIYAAVEILLVGLAFMLIILNRRALVLGWQISRCSLRWFVLFLACSLGFAVFSANAFYSIFFAGEFLSQILLIFTIVAGAQSRQALVKRVLYCCLIVTVLSISFKFVRNGFGGELFAYKSNAGAACACMGTVFSLAVVLSDTFGNRKLGIATFVTCAIGVVVTTSAASIISTFFGISIACFLLGKGRAPLVILVLAVAAFFAFNPEIAFQVLFPGKDMDQVTTLHGRTTFWDDAIELINHRPFFGFGYAMAAKIGSMGGTNLHNSLFSVVLGTGFFGTAIFLLGLFGFAKEAYKLVVTNVPLAGAAVASFLAALLNSNSISFYGEDWRGASFLFVLMWAVVGFLAIKTKDMQSIDDKRLR